MRSDTFCARPVDTIEFRASMVIGGGSLSFELLRVLTNRLPVMLCPRWLATRTQPIAIADVVAFLAAQDLPPGALSSPLRDRRPGRGDLPRHDPEQRLPQQAYGGG